MVCVRLNYLQKPFINSNLFYEKISTCFINSPVDTKLIGTKKIHSIQLSGGRSWHGTGDLKGIMFDVSYDHTIKKRIDFSNGLTTTIHYGKDDELIGIFPNPASGENLLRFTTAGIQLTSLMNFAFLYSPDNQLKVGGGPILRFQSSSLPDIYAYYQDPNVFPAPFYVFNYRTKQNTFSIGYAFGVTYLTKISLKYEVGIKAFFQNDTNGDAITSISLILGALL